MSRPNATGVIWSDREARNSYAREWAGKRLPIIRNQIIELLGSECKHCENSDIRVLDIDHVNGGGRQERKKRGGSLNYYTQMLRAIESGSQEYRLLCKNCNWIAYKHSK